MVLASVIFAIFPIMVAWALLAIVCSDPGFVTLNMVDKICHEYGIDQDDYPTAYELYTQLNYKYFQRVGILHVPEDQL